MDFLTKNVFNGIPTTSFTLTQMVAMTLVAGSLGMWIGRAQTASLPSRRRSVKKETNYEEEDDLTPVQETFSSKRNFPPIPSSGYKMVLLVRTDLGMTKGKVAAQCCHACLAAYKVGIQNFPEYVKGWERDGQAKITLKVPSEAEMLDLERVAKANDLPARSILDAGHTQIPAGSRTVLAVGPGPIELIDQITGHLKLF